MSSASPGAATAAAIPAPVTTMTTTTTAAVYNQFARPAAAATTTTLLQRPPQKRRAAEIDVDADADVLPPAAAGAAAGAGAALDDRPYQKRSRAEVQDADDTELAHHRRILLQREYADRARTAVVWDFKRQRDALRVADTGVNKPAVATGAAAAVAATESEVVDADDALPPQPQLSERQMATALRVFAAEYPVDPAAAKAAAAAVDGAAAAPRRTRSVPESLRAADPAAAAALEAASSGGTGGGGGSSGARRYLVARYTDFWWQYLALDKLKRNHYELIRHTQPCNLYFDIEFATTPNPHVDGNVAVELLVSRIIAQFAHCYGLTISRRAFVDLECTTTAKYSRHLIVRLCDGTISSSANRAAAAAVEPGPAAPATAAASSSSSAAAAAPARYAFANNLHAGAFVRELCSAIERERTSTHPALNALYVHPPSASAAVTAAAAGNTDGSNAEAKKVLFVDTGVYTRNRCFRLFLSCKAGKTEPLYPASAKSRSGNVNSASNVRTDGTTLAPVPFQRYSYRPAQQKEYFLASLVGNTLPPALGWRAADEHAKATTAAVAAATGGADEQGSVLSADRKTTAELAAAFAALPPLQYLTCNPAPAVVPASAAEAATPATAASATVSLSAATPAPSPPAVVYRIVSSLAEAGAPASFDFQRTGSVVVSSGTRMAPHASAFVSWSGATGASWHQRHRSDGASPFPRLELAVTRAATLTDGDSAAVAPVAVIKTYRYALSADGRMATICYNITGNRWCARIGRAHKSNGKYAVCVLLPATSAVAEPSTSAAAAAAAAASYAAGSAALGFVPYFHFKCHDPECRGWRSDDFRIEPNDVLQKPKPPPKPPAAAAAASNADDERAFEAALSEMPLP